MSTAGPRVLVGCKNTVDQRAVSGLAPSCEGIWRSKFLNGQFLIDIDRRHPSFTDLSIIDHPSTGSERRILERWLNDVRLPQEAVDDIIYTPRDHLVLRR